MKGNGNIVFSVESQLQSALNITNCGWDTAIKLRDQYLFDALVKGLTFICNLFDTIVVGLL